MGRVLRSLNWATRSEGRTGKPQQYLGLPPYHRRLVCEALEARTLLSVGLAQVGSAAHHQTLADLPVLAQQAISSAIGQDEAAYHAASAAAGLTLANPANGYTARLQSGALQVSTGSDTWDMSLVGLGYGGAMQPVGTAKTSANGNRVDCNYGPIDEWYVNGPSGLEQGFTVTPPQSNASGSLTVELALGGDLVGMVNAAKDGLTLSELDGSTALGYTGLSACDATGKTLPASMGVQVVGGHQDLLIQVIASGAQGPISIDPFVQEAKLTASNGAVGDGFGGSVSISGNTLVVGAASVPGNIGQGAAYVFTEPASGWTNMVQTAKLTASDGAVTDFGWSVSINGNTIVVGSQHAVVNGNGYPGAAYVFTEPASGWANMTQTAKLTASDGVYDDYFGCSVSISGNTVVVGAKYATVGGNGQQGAAYVFTEPASGWANMTQTAKLTASDGGLLDQFGDSVSITGNTVVVGANFDTLGESEYRGAAYVFTEPASGWADMTQTAELTASDGAGFDEFGESVSISGNTVVVGGRWAFTANTVQGAAYVFTEPTSGWAGNMKETAKLTASDGASVDWDYFGDSVSISGNTVVVGDYGPIVNGNMLQGAAYVFMEPASGWANMTQTAKLTASDGAAGDFFGCSVSISGSTIVVGAPGATVNGNTDQGAAYVSCNSVFGIDVSHYQGTIGASGWSQVFNPGGKTFAYVKASQGVHYPAAYVQYFYSNAALAQSAHLVVGADHFAAPDRVPNNPTALAADAIKEADYFVQVAGSYLKAGYLQPMLDLETGDPNNGGGCGGLELKNDWAQIAQWTAAWIAELQHDVPGLTPILYMDRDYASNLLGVLPSLTSYRLWISATGDPSSSPQPYGDWDPDTWPWSIWQYYPAPKGASANVSGIQVGTDLDTLNPNISLSDLTIKQSQITATVTGASSTQATGAYDAGTEIPITLEFDEAVTVTGTPQLLLNEGGVANYTGGSGTWRITFTYVVPPGQSTSDLDYASTAGLVLNGGSVQDLWGNTAVLTLPATGTDGLATQNIVIGSAPMTVTPADWTAAGLTLTLGSDGNAHVYTTGTTADVVAPSPLGSVPNIEITSPSDTTANLTIDSSAGNPMPVGGLNYSGGGGLIITGSGTVALSGPNTYTGGTTVSAGTLL
ncbi:MAG: GH25 family lysozyme, partial [Thermoguttaceae bacterium]